jgi:HJR/Mrr/RecB family endonuclease
MPSSLTNLAELSKTIRAWQELMPRINPDVAALLSNPTIEAFKAHQETLRVLPKLAPEFVETMQRIQEMNRLLAGDANSTILATEITANNRLLEAAISASVFSSAAGKDIRDFLVNDQWPIMQSFQYEGEDIVLADIGLAGIFEDPTEEPSAPTLEETSKVKRIITDIFQDDKTLLRLEPHTFEAVIAELFRSQGFTVELTKRTRDGGYDLIAISLQAGFPLKFLVECKRYTQEKVGIDIVRSLMYVVQQEQANKGIIATTSYFTRDVREHQRSIQPYLLDLRDKNDVLSWIRHYGEEKLRLRKDS